MIVAMMTNHQMMIQLTIVYISLCTVYITWRKHDHKIVCFSCWVSCSFSFGMLLDTCLCNLSQTL